MNSKYRSIILSEKIPNCIKSIEYYKNIVKEEMKEDNKDIFNGSTPYFDFTSTMNIKDLTALINNIDVNNISYSNNINKNEENLEMKNNKEVVEFDVPIEDNIMAAGKKHNKEKWAPLEEKPNSNNIVSSIWSNTNDNKNNSSKIINNSETKITPKFEHINQFNIENDKKNLEKYEYVSHPSHYNLYDIEAVDMIYKIYGDKCNGEFMPLFCEATALLYRLRMGLKPENSVIQELNKEHWWLEKRDSYKNLKK